MDWFEPKLADGLVSRVLDRGQGTAGRSDARRRGRSLVAARDDSTTG
jgi:hypothetical protein